MLSVIPNIKYIYICIYTSCIHEEKVLTQFPLKGVLRVKGVLGPRARARQGLQIEAFYARARGPRTPFTPRTSFKGNCVFWRCIYYDCSSYKCLQALDAETKKLYALSATLRRVCTPKPSSGKLEVSQEVYKQWKQNGEPRKALLKVLMNAGGDKDQFRVVCTEYTIYAQYATLYIV